VAGRTAPDESGQADISRVGYLPIHCAEGDTLPYSQTWDYETRLKSVTANPAPPRYGGRHPDDELQLCRQRGAGHVNREAGGLPAR
jgi:hypothetical protein